MDTNKNTQNNELSDDELDIVASGSLQSLINAGITYLCIAQTIAFYGSGGGIGQIIGNGLHK